MNSIGFTNPSSISHPALTQEGVRAVRIWLWCMAALVFAMVVVGGATRMTESGLSITEWKVITGVLPPLGEAAWMEEFRKYQQIPQYSQMFPDMTLGQFKVIFYWEWAHRLLGRFLGFAFALPLAFFWWRGYLRGGLRWQLVALLALGGLQGAVGWWMVKSGLSTRTEVAQERLATHLLLASITFSWIAWIATGLRARSAAPAEANGRLRIFAYAITVLVLVQIALGALVAGLRAGLTYNTWPLMDGHFIPPLENLLRLSPVVWNFLDNVTTVQFQHRMVAYLLFIVALWHAIDALRAAPGTAAARRAVTLAGLVLAQAAIGIVTLLLVVPLWAGLLHQAFAMVVLGMAVVHAKRMSEAGRQEAAQPAALRA